MAWGQYQRKSTLPTLEPPYGGEARVWWLDRGLCLTVWHEARAGDRAMGSGTIITKAPGVECQAVGVKYADASHEAELAEGRYTPVARYKVLGSRMVGARSHGAAQGHLTLTGLCRVAEAVPLLVADTCLPTSADDA